MYFLPETAASFPISQLKPLKTCNLTNISHVISSMAVYNIKMLFIYSSFIPNFWKPLFILH